MRPVRFSFFEFFRLRTATTKELQPNARNLRHPVKLSKQSHRDDIDQKQSLWNFELFSFVAERRCQHPPEHVNNSSKPNERKTIRSIDEVAQCSHADRASMIRQQL